MNRVIKFRVWDTQLNLWVNNIGMSKNNILTYGTEKRFHVMQFTGLQDKNGVDIYEGDIIKHPNQDKLGVVRYEPNACQFRIQYAPETYIPSCHIGLNIGEKGMAYVIGNIYEHPQLLTPTPQPPAPHTAD